MTPRCPTRPRSAGTTGHAARRAFTRGAASAPVTGRWLGGRDECSPYPRAPAGRRHAPGGQGEIESPTFRLQGVDPACQALLGPTAMCRCVLVGLCVPGGSQDRPVATGMASVSNPLAGDGREWPPTSVRG